MAVPAKTSNATEVRIIDIRQEQLDDSLLKLTVDGLNSSNGQARSLPTLLLYDERGLKLFEDITYVEEYYLTNTEIEVLTEHADKIAERIPAGSQLLELGSGNLRKIDILLQAFERAKKQVQYYALDLSLSELKRTFAQISPDSYKFVKCAALLGTYDDALVWLSQPESRAIPTCVMSMGSSMGNFSRESAADFLHGFAKAMTIEDTMLIALDACQDTDRVYRAYNDSQGLTEQFYRNGLDHANRLLGRPVFKQEDWAVVGTYDSANHRHEAHYSALNDVHSSDLIFKKGESLHLEYAYKYSEAQSDDLWRSAGLIRSVSFGNKRDDYYIHLLKPFKVAYPDKPENYAAQPVPSLKDWEELWNAWDTVTRAMIPNEELLAKPIQLRNNLIFYLGHIPTFADIHMSRATGKANTEPKYYPQIFERGIDPDVDDPNQCHDHSEIPDTWPPLDEILLFQNRVRNRVRDLIISGQANSDRKLGRSLWLGFEHEVMHLETFLYMLLQSERILPPPGSPGPDFSSLAEEARNHSVPNDWFKIPAAKVTIGLDDPENDDGPDRYFGWDNERPSRNVVVPSFEAQARPITNGDYAVYLEKIQSASFPASWTTSRSAAVNGLKQVNGSNGVTNGYVTAPVSDAFLRNKAIRTVYGLVPLKYALDWPLMASYNELAQYANWMDGRIPSLEEARSIYNYVEELKKDIAERVPSTLISAVNGHLSNDGVEETPPQGRGLDGFSNGENRHSELSADKHFIDLTGCNVGFKNWHPTSVAQHGNRLCGQGDFGGVWEWTSSPLENFEGFKAMDLYPGYTADFFDGKHNIMLGGSWATHPRIAGRKSFVNWYQRNYPFVWAGARLVRDIKA